MPILNYATPLYNFNVSGNTSYTATKECYLLGTFYKSNAGYELKINNTLIARTDSANDSLFIGPLKLNIGDTVTVTNVTPLVILEEITL